MIAKGAFGNVLKVYRATEKCPYAMKVQTQHVKMLCIVRCSFACHKFVQRNRDTWANLSLY